jgi:hypothetical protein
VNRLRRVLRALLPPMERAAGSFKAF